MSNIVFVLPVIFVVITLAAAGYDQQHGGMNQYGQAGQYGHGQAGYGGSGGYGSGGSYGRKRREIPSLQQKTQPGQPQAASQPQPGQQQQPQFQPVRGPKKFSVNVNDGIQGANQLRKESWDNGTVTGMYANPLGNKKYQIINYIADDKGYRVLSTKVVDETELAQLGGANKFSPQSGKSAQIDITNDGNTASWSVTPDQINQVKQAAQKTQPEGRSTKDKDSKDKDMHADDMQQDEAEAEHKQGKRSVDDKVDDKTKDEQNDQPQEKQEGKRGRRAMNMGGMGHGMGGGMGHGMGGGMGHGMGGGMGHGMGNHMG